MAQARKLPKKPPLAAKTRQRNLPLILLGGALGLVLLGVLILLRQNPASVSPAVEVAGQPRLSVDREQIDFGKVPLDKVVRAEFQLRNVGDQALQIQGVPAVEVKEGC